MYEYRCSDESCGHVWTIKEGGIGSSYLSCPNCKKGRGMFLRQIKGETSHDDIRNLPIKMAYNSDILAKETVEQETDQEPVNEKVSLKEETIKTEQKKASEPDKEENKPVPAAKKHEGKKEHPDTAPAIREKKNKDIKVKVNTSVSEEEEDIFERIKRKRKQEEEFKKNCGDDVDVMEFSGNSIEEIEKRISEFEQYYYIKVLDKSIVEQGRRINCIIKYCRK